MSQQVIYIDPASIHNEILRRHPEIEQSYCHLGRSTTDPFAIISDTTECVEGHEIDIYRTDPENYFGFTVEINRWRHVDPSERGKG